MKPGDFPIGSPESRAAARAILIERSGEDGEFSADCLVSWTGLPAAKWSKTTTGSAPTATPPDTLAYYTMPDSSFVQVIRRHWEGEGRSGVTASIHQYSADGGAYNGSYEVEDLSQLKRFGCRMDEITAKEKCRAIFE
jgi:hypothetical protein